MSESKLPYLTHHKKIKASIRNNQVNILYEYDQYDVTILEFFDQIGFSYLFKEENLMNYLMDHMFLESETNRKWRPIHYLCKYSTPEVIRTMIGKRVCLESSTNYGFRPIHFICTHSTSEMIRYFIDQGVSLECRTDHGFRPIHMIAQYSDAETYHMVSKMVNMNAKTNKGYTPDRFFRYNRNLSLPKKIPNVEIQHEVKKSNTHWIFISMMGLIAFFIIWSTVAL